MFDAFDPVAGLCTAFQYTSLDFAEFNFIVDACIADLQAIVYSPDEASENFIIDNNNRQSLEQE